MCRGKDHGGRRCPAERDPEKIKARNARRRAAYALKKKQQQNKLVLPPQKTLGSKEQVSSSFVLKKSVARKHNVKADIYGGADVDNGYIAKEQLHGTIDYTTLNENSYKTFGFQSPQETRTIGLSNKEIINLSRQEMKNRDVPMLGQGGMHTITTNQYEWINMALYGQEPCLVANPSNLKKALPVNPNAKTYEDTGLSDETYPCPARLQQVTKAADEGLKAACDGRQRIVYRGVKGYSPFIEEAGGLTAYVDENYQLGSTVQWDGYNSTCIVPDIAVDYAGYDSGIVYEIRAASGANVSGISAYDTEKEYLLPRASKFMVVGVHKNVNLKYEAENTSPHTKAKKRTAKAESMTVIQLVEVTDDGRIQDSETVKTRKNPALTANQLALEETELDMNDLL